MTPTSPTPAPAPAPPPTSIDLKTWLAETAGRLATFPVAATEFGDGFVVSVRHLTLADRFAIEAVHKGDTPAGDKLMQILPLCLAAPGGARLFEAGDPLLKLLPASLAERVVTEAMRVSTGGVADAKKA